MVSRRTRVLVILGLFGWTLSGVPERVQQQRAAVADLAAERGAASAGGALLAAMADLKALGPAEDDGVWTLVPGTPCGGIPAATGYQDAVNAVRGVRACKALTLVPEGATTPRLAVVDGDAYLVLPGPVAWQAGSNLYFENLEVTDLRDLRMTEARSVVVAEPGAYPAPPAPPAAPAPAAEVATPAPPAPPPDPPAAPDLPFPPDFDGDPAAAAARDLAEARLAEANARLAQKAAELAGQAADLDRLQVMEADEANRTGVRMGRTVIQTLQALGELGIVEFDVGELGEPAPAPPSLLLSPATVAWWPPVQAQVEAQTGIPLQVGGDPPHARAILPGHRLAGVPVWSLPTPATEGAFDLLDGGAALWLIILAGLLVREYVMFNRAQGDERDRQAARDTILQRLSHELRTPAASVRSLVDALAHPNTSDAERSQFLDLVRSEAERLSVGIDRLLQAARGDASVKVDPVQLDLAEWAEGVRARWVARLPGLIVHADRPSPALADPERLDEAVDALLDNARIYGGPDVVLGVSADRISVEDNGEGVPPRDRARILDKFERIEGRVNDPGGHGLGLWAVGEVARAHGGKLTIEGSSRFVITLGRP